MHFLRYAENILQMGSAKQIVLKSITGKAANSIIKQLHYSGKVVNNSQLHIGVFLNKRLEGALQFGPSLDKRRMMGLVKNTKWNDFIELNRMAFSDVLPRNSESRALSVAMRLLKKNAPHLKWVVTFADGAQCGDGTIYRASGFYLVGIKKNTQMWAAPDSGVVFSRMSLTDGRSKSVQASAGMIVSRVSVTKGKHITNGNGSASMKRYAEAGFKPIKGFQLKYIYFLDKSCLSGLTVPILPFSKIKEMGAGMYKGKKCG